jgi:hypothetical protein
MRPTTFIGLGALVVMGLIVGDFLTHPAGTQALGQSVVNFQKTSGNQLLGVAA